MMPLPTGSVVVVYLREPREQVLGLLESLDGAGVTVRGLGLDSVEDWTALVVRGERGGLAPSLVFYPLLRVEKVMLDESSGTLPSFQERFASRTGRDLAGALAEPPGEGERE
jgi:hypothetical protein